MPCLPMSVFCLQVELTAERGLAVNADQQVSDLLSKPLESSFSE